MSNPEGIQLDGQTSENLKREIAYNDAMSRRYDDDYHEAPIMRSHTRDFVDFAAAHIRPDARVLDLGCASASLWPDFRRVFPSAVTMTGVDVSPEMLAVAKEKFPDGRFLVGTMTSIPAEDSEFDVVIVSSAFHHVADELLPVALREVKRVLSEHGILIGREPLQSGRVGDRGGALAGSLMALRHIAYRITGARDLPEPDPGPDHHAYDAEDFLRAIEAELSLTHISFANPVSHFLARSRSPIVTEVAMVLDDLVRHREGQEVLYVAQKNFVGIREYESLIEAALAENQIDDIARFVAYLDEAGRVFQTLLDRTHVRHDRDRAWLTERRIRYFNKVLRK